MMTHSTVDDTPHSSVHAEARTDRDREGKMPFGSRTTVDDHDDGNEELGAGKG